MKNEGQWNESFDEFRSDEGEHAPAQFSSRSSRLQNAEQEARDSSGPEIAHFEAALQQLPQPILESSREGGNGSWEEGDTSRQQQELAPQQIEAGSPQTYYRVGPNGEREVIRVTAISPPIPNQVTVPLASQAALLGPPQQMPPHFPPSPRMSHPPLQRTSSQLKSLDNLRNVTQQSFAPSQKTIVLNHISNQINGGVYHSHVSTERIPTQPQREPNTRHSHVHDTRVGSPTRVSFDYAQTKPNLFSSYIPPSGGPVIAERSGAISTSNAPPASERHCQHPDEANFWREKYEELSRRWQAMRLKEGKEQEVALSKFAALEKNYQLLQATYDQLVQDYHAKLDENQQYFQQIQQLQSALNQLQLSPKRGEEDGGGAEGLQTALEEKSMLVGLLRKENEQFQAHLEALEQRHQQEMRDMQEHATMLQMEVEQREAQLRERGPMKGSAMRRSDNSALMLDRSRMESFENTHIMELEMHVGKLNAEMKMREESFERELRMANLNVAELVEKLKTVASEKDQLIRNLQEKVGLLESDINKKESIIRNLRDDAVRLTSQPPPASVYSSAVNPLQARGGERQQVFRRELESMRRNLFQREREKLILKQKYEQLEERALQSEEALARRKVESQALRRQLTDLDNLQHENDKLMEVLAKKNSEMMEMKEMLLEKQQHAGDFENLSKQNERLRGFMLKKNEEISEMAEQLFVKEKRLRELQQSHSPQLRQLEEERHQLQQELHRLEDLLARKDIEIGKLNQSLELVEGNFSEIEFELERHRNINQEYEAQIRANMERLQVSHDQLVEMEGEKQVLEREVAALRTQAQDFFKKLGEREEREAQAKRQVQEITQQLQEAKQQLDNVTLEQAQLREFKQKSAKEIQIFQSKQGDLQLRVRDLESLLRNREQRLGRAQREAEEGREQLKKHQGCAKQLEQMSQRISNYEMRIISLTLHRSQTALADYPPPSEIFENKLIYDLQRQNQALRSQLGTLRSEPSSSNQQEGSDIKVRLDQFSHNLQSAIGGGLKRVRSVEALQQQPADQGQDSIILQQNREIERLKQLAQEMQQQELLEGSFSARKKKVTPEYLEQLYQEELAFFRTKNAELEQRVNNLLRVNKELKGQMEQSLAQRGASMKTFYESQMRRLQREVGQLRGDKTRSLQTQRANERKIRQLEDQLRRSRKRADIPRD